MNTYTAIFEDNQGNHVHRTIQAENLKTAANTANILAKEMDATVLQIQEDIF